MILKNKYGTALLACVLALMPVYASFSFASSADELRTKLTEIEQKKRDAEVRRADAERERRAIGSELAEIGEQLKSLDNEARALRGKMNKLQVKIDDNKAKLAKKQAEIAARHKIYKKRLRDIYINGQINYLDVLLGAKDFSDFSSRMFLLQKIVKSDLTLIDEIKAAAAEITARQQELDGQMAELSAAKKALDARIAKVNAIRERRRSMFSKAQATEKQSERKIDELEAESATVTNMLRQMESSGQVNNSGGGASGAYMWPCRGEITSYFGWRTHPIFGTTKYHSGMDIAVDYGTPIHATNSGTVVYSGWLGGYGNCVMIDHGSGLVSLYGHNQSLTVSEGQYVGRGTVIAYAGSTGYSTGPHCHFEMRLHGEVTEPLNYLP